MVERAPEQQITMRLDEREIRLWGRHKVYLDGLAGTNVSSDPLIDLARRAPHGGIYLDVGANIGATAIPVALSRPDLHVVGFEPVPDNADFLERNIAANGVPNCTVVRCAVGSDDSRATINENGPWSMVSLGGLSIRTTTLDTWCEDNARGAAVHLVKVDAEGYEPRVLAGAWRILQKWRPPIVIEFNSFCLLAQSVNPVAFARTIIEQFDVVTDATQTFSDAVELVHDNMIRHACVNNLVLVPRRDLRRLDVDAICFSSGAAAELRALRASTSWRITRPLRLIRRLIPLPRARGAAEAPASARPRSSPSPPRRS